MPLMTGQTTLTGATQVSSTTATTGITASDANAIVVYMHITVPAAAITIGKSNIATVPGATLTAATNVPLPFGFPGCALKEIYFKGTDAQVVNWTAIVS